jgi:hypothetical protein
LPGKRSRREPPSQPSPWQTPPTPPSPPAQPDLTPVNGGEVLEKLAALPISTWNYVFDDASVRHLGPMAQDFAAAFGLGDSDKVINMVDANGVVMVAIQALYRRVQALEAEVSALRGARDEPTPE